MVAVIANRGRLVTPTLVKTVCPNDGSAPVPEPPSMVSRVPVSPKDLELIHKGLVAVVNESGGTASVARVPGFTVAGKTGSAQVVGLSLYKSYGTETQVPWKYRDHALFTAYAPAEDPTIALAVVVEHGLHGGSSAGAVARQVLEAYFGVPSRPEKSSKRPGPLADYPDPASVAAGMKPPPTLPGSKRCSAPAPQPVTAVQPKMQPFKPEPYNPGQFKLFPFKLEPAPGPQGGGGHP
jgi:penicillin-binding protein 2